MNDEDQTPKQPLEDKIEDLVEEKVEKKMKEASLPGSSENTGKNEQDTIDKKIEEKIGKRVGEKGDEGVFKKSYRIRESLFVLFGRIIVVGIILLLVFYLISFLYVTPEERAIIQPTPFYTETEPEETISLMTVMAIALHLINLIVIAIILLRWFFRQYVIAPQEIYFIRGVIIKQKDVYHIQAMVSVRVSQGVLGKILNYGTIRLESPLIRRDVLLKNLPNPHEHAAIIERQRVKSIKSIVTENVLPSAT